MASAQVSCCPLCLCWTYFKNSYILCKKCKTWFNVFLSFRFILSRFVVVVWLRLGFLLAIFALCLMYFGLFSFQCFYLLCWCCFCCENNLIWCLSIHFNLFKKNNILLLFFSYYFFTQMYQHTNIYCCGLFLFLFLKNLHLIFKSIVQILCNLHTIILRTSHFAL